MVLNGKRNYVIKKNSPLYKCTGNGTMTFAHAATVLARNHETTTFAIKNVTKEQTQSNASSPVQESAHILHRQELEKIHARGRQPYVGHHP